MENKDPSNFNESDSSSDTSSNDSYDDISGPDFADFARRLTYDNTNGITSNKYYHPFVDNSDKKEPLDTYVFPSTLGVVNNVPFSTENTSLFLIDSVNRDKNAFPQPTNFTLRLPRVYKNVSSIQVTELKLLCSFYYFSVSKSNIYLPVIERGRLKTVDINGNLTNITNTGIPLTENITIREGTYSISELLSEIQREMNFTPLFYDFPNGFVDFTRLFSINGDYSINFNQPGDNYYDSLNDKYITNPTMNLIVSYYWGTRYAGLTEYTIDQLKVAYYYPVLYEVFLDKIDKTAKPSLNLTYQDGLLLEGQTVYSRIIFNMSGINDKVALYFINQNISVLDKYRLNHTFRYSLVNRYEVTYDPQSLRVNFTTITLNTSLVNLINNTGSSSLTSILNNFGLTTATYAALQASVNIINVVYADMFRYLQTQFTTLLGIPFATYGPQFFNNLSNYIYFQDGTNATGIRTSYTNEYLQSGANLITLSGATYSNSPRYWPNLTASKGYTGLNASRINIAKSLIPYNTLTENFQFGTNLFNPTTFFFNTNRSTRTVDVVVDILPAQYTVFKFRSPVRQSLQVETLPLPYYYRYSDFNKQGLYKNVLDLNKNNVPKQYFDISYAFIYNSSNSLMDNSNYKRNVLPTSFGQSLLSSISSSTTYRANTESNYTQYEFIAPYPPGITGGLCVNNTSLSFLSILNGNISTLFPDKFRAFVYHDRAAFMADLIYPRSENPLHYINSASVDSTKSDLTINFSTFSGHTYYTIFRSENINSINTLYKPLVYYNNSNYTQINTDYVNFNPYENPSNDLNNYPIVTNYNKDFTRLPTDPKLMGLDPSLSTFNTGIKLLSKPIGYDISGVSNDLTDYMGYTSGTPGFVPGTRIRVDPLSYYHFQSITPFDSDAGSYFGSNSSNTILESITNNVYIHKGISTSQKKIVHWYDNYSIPRQLDDRFISFTTLGIANTLAISDYITTYPLFSPKNIKFGRGINAIGFLPTDGQYSISSFSFKSSIYPLTNTFSTQEDPNLQIASIGVFNGLALVNPFVTLSSAISVLKFNKSIPYGPATLKNTPGFGLQLGTWYDFIIDQSFIPTDTSNISGYTASSNEILSYNSMYYMVPFDSSGNMMTYSLLSGSLTAYPLATNITVQNTFYGATVSNPPGVNAQQSYILPTLNPSAAPSLGPQGSNSLIQSQYEQSIPITTTSIGFRDISYLSSDINAPFTFTTVFSNTNPTGTVIFFSEFSNTTFLVTPLSNTYSNTLLSIPCATYASTLSTSIKLYDGIPESIYYLLNPAPPQQNYTISGKIRNISTFTFQSMSGTDSNVTTRSFELKNTMSNVTLWMWGGGGGSWSNSSNISGGAGAYVKVSIDINTLLNTKTPDAPNGLSTIYLVVGKGGNRDNFSVIETVGSLQLYEEPRYGGGGTSLLGNFIDNDSISLQGGGFSGIFSGSNLRTATPLLIVGGGGAGGAADLGGPGGFGISPTPLNKIQYPFNNAIFNGRFYSRLAVSRIDDIFKTNYLNASVVQNAADNNILNYWNPVIPAVLNPQNYIPTPNTYGVSLRFANNLTSLSKIRYYGPPQSNLTNIPTGFIVYNDLNKTQILYSNTSIQPDDFQIIDNGIFLQQIFEIFPDKQPLATTINTNASLLVGNSITSQNSIQYSLDGITWVPTNNPSLTVVTSIQYVAPLSKWFATGTNIIQSSDGMNWTDCTVNNFTGIIFTSIIFASNIIVAGADNGSMYTSLDGNVWTSLGKVFSSYITRLRYLNGTFWAFSASSGIKTSVNGINWVNSVIMSLIGVNDATFGINRYVLAQYNNTPPFNSGLLFSQDGITWSPCNQIGIQKFSPLSVIYSKNVFVAVGLTTDGSSFIKYSIDGINWSNSSYDNFNDVQREDIQIVGTKFVCTGQGLQGTGLSSNQLSVITSDDGITWSYSLSGGFNVDENNPNGYSAAYSSAYGPVTILPNMSTLYIEILKESFTDDTLNVYELRVYDTTSNIPGNTSALIDNNITTLFSIPNSNVLDVLEYPFVMSFTTPVPLINIIQIYVPSDSQSQFLGITIQLNSSSTSIIYEDLNIPLSSFIYNSSTGLSLYTVLLVPPLVNISTLYVKFTKINTGSIKIYDFSAQYDPNLAIVSKLPSIITDLDNRPASNPLTNIIDTNLSTSWNPTSFITGDLLRLNFTFSAPVDRINHIQIYNGQFPETTDTITGISIFIDSTKATQVYTNPNITLKQYKEYSIFDFHIPALIGYSNVYIELYKNTPGIPKINEIKFYNIGLITDDAGGYSGGNTITSTKAIYGSYNGGGGSSNVGGQGGLYAVSGSYLTGGSPVILQSQITLSNTSQIQYGSGGGGGGFYGGGGGGFISDLQGGAGGGGAGYIYKQQPIFTILDYNVATPGSNTTIKNYISPGLTEQRDLINTNIIYKTNISYGQGGIPGVDSAKGGHGIVILSYDIDSSIPPKASQSINPSFIDGSRLSVFQAPILKDTELRRLEFNSYSDTIELTQYSGYNWVWFRSYLSLVGCSLTSSMIVIPSVPSLPTETFPYLDASVYYGIIGLNNINFNLIVDSFKNGFTPNRIDIVTTRINQVFNAFIQQFVKVSYSDPSYVQLTEIYCLLDYLRDPLNLENPHVNTSNSRLDRIFGGIPRFGYWANPFLVNVSYIGFDVITSQIPSPALSTLVKSSSPVQAMYGLVLEQSLITGKYEFKDIMAYKPTVLDGSNWLMVTQFPESYVIRSLTNNTFVLSNIPVQPYTFKNAILGRLSLFKYSVYTAPSVINSKTYDIPIHILNDFEGQSIYLYSFQNTLLENQSTINISQVYLTSTILSMNQNSISRQPILSQNILGTVVSEYTSTIVQAVTSFGFNGSNYIPQITYSSGSNNYYNTFNLTSPLQNSNVGKAITDMYGNYYITDNSRGTILYENICTIKIYPNPLSNSSIPYASPKFILTQYNNANLTPYTDILVSKFDNIWHIPALNFSNEIYGVRLNSKYDYTTFTSFANQIFYPTHKITLVKTGFLENPMTDVTDMQKYPSYQRTEMFFYNNYTTMINDIGSNFAMENTNNFVYRDMFSGYGFNSYLNNIKLDKSLDLNNGNLNSFYYLAIRAYSPSERFQSLVRFYLPNRYDFGYISLLDLSNEQQAVNTNTNTNVNPYYKSFISLFNESFSTNRLYGSTGLPGFLGSNISTTGFGDFLRVYNSLNAQNQENTNTLSTITGLSNASLKSLINNDLQYILPSYLASRNRITDPIEFSIPFSTSLIQNTVTEQYGLGYNLGFVLADTEFNTVQRATSFFKILDDYIYLQLNEEFNMNKMDVSQPENFARTREATAQTGIYNSKLLLNTFGQYATTFIQNPVTFAPTIGKLDKLSFSWYDSKGTILNNIDCEWSGTIQITELVNTSNTDLTSSTDSSGNTYSLDNADSPDNKFFNNKK
jgi:hypothetical protein